MGHATPNAQGSVVNVMTMSSGVKSVAMRETPSLTPASNTAKRMSEATPNVYGHQPESKTSANNTKRNSISTHMAENSMRYSLTKQKESRLRNQESLNHQGSKQKRKTNQLSSTQHSISESMNANGLLPKGRTGSSKISKERI